MAIEFGCPSCQQVVRVADSAAGKRGKCPHCAAIVEIPAAGAAASAAPKPAKPGTVSFPCPGCGKSMSAPAALAGKKGKCPHCQTVFVVGGGSAAAPSAPAFGGLQPLGEADLQPLDIPAAAPHKPLASPSGGLAPLGPADDLFASLPSGPTLAPLPAAPSPLGYTPSPTSFGSPSAPNPYAPNPYTSPGMPPSGISRPAYAPLKLMIPAIAMIVIAVLTIGSVGIMTVSAMIAPADQDWAPGGNPQIDKGSMAYKSGQMCGGVLSLLINIGVIAGGIQMIRLRGWDTARGGAVAACVPCLSLLCLNIPFGIWALVVLFQPDVRRMFQ